ncbi:MAG: hypothetical protein VX528_01420 [Candidatus Latescibacterota bacterium]|nr:hypothetical protein [Candidatus Latescibacterota bacterium]
MTESVMLDLVPDHEIQTRPDHQLAGIGKAGRRNAQSSGQAFPTERPREEFDQLRNSAGVDIDHPASGGCVDQGFSVQGSVVDDLEVDVAESFSEHWHALRPGEN